MKLSVEAITLHLETPFRIAHGTSTARQNVLVHLGEGVGEGALAPYYGHRLAEVVAYVESLEPEVLLGDDPLALEDSLDRLPPGPPPARAAIDIALHDHWAQQLGQPLHRLWGLNPARTPLSSLTIGITQDENELRQQVRTLAHFPILKLKLGTGDLEADEATVRLVRQETEARLCVDANCAWTVEEAVHIIHRLTDYDLLFIEQPIPHTDVAEWHRLRRLLPKNLPPLIADESAVRPRDIPPLAGAAEGINIKLSKAGGLREARRMIYLARALGMKVMLGCMVESSVAITAAAHLSPLVDFADLDGHLNLVNDPYLGVALEAGRISLPSGAGLGVVRRGQAQDA
jgi:L-alanine-DL-glutamate epimerase-like enolase superfamily enzyme